MTLLTAFEIANNYPDQISIGSGQDKETGKWVGFMYRLKGSQVHKLMCSSNPIFDTPEAAEKVMHDACQSAIDHIKTLKK